MPAPLSAERRSEMADLALQARQLASRVRADLASVPNERAVLHLTQTALDAERIALILDQNLDRLRWLDGLL